MGYSQLISIMLASERRRMLQRGPFCDPVKTSDTNHITFALSCRRRIPKPFFFKSFIFTKGNRMTSTHLFFFCFLRYVRLYFPSLNTRSWSIFFLRLASFETRQIIFVSKREKNVERPGAMKRTIKTHYSPRHVWRSHFVTPCECFMRLLSVSDRYTTMGHPWSSFMNS